VVFAAATGSDLFVFFPDVSISMKSSFIFISDDAVA